MNKPFATLAALALLAMAAPVSAETFGVAQDSHTLNEVSFTSQAPLVKFTGRTSKIMGSVSGDPTNLSTVKGEFKVDLASLDTGIALRDEHMRGFLKTDKYPFASLKIHTIKGAKSLKPNQSTALTVLGDLTLHGTTRPVSFPARVTYLPEQDAKFRPGTWVELSSEFQLKLSDYGIALPKMILGPKVSDDVTLGLVAAARAGGMAGGKGMNPCNPCAAPASKMNPCNPCAMH